MWVVVDASRSICCVAPNVNVLSPPATVMPVSHPVPMERAVEATVPVPASVMVPTFMPRAMRLFVVDVAVIFAIFIA